MQYVSMVIIAAGITFACLSMSGCVQAPPKGVWYGTTTEPDCAPWHHKHNLVPPECNSGTGGQ